jgi:hippurate hydrolase
VNLLADARSIAEDLTDLRHRLHRYPEVGLSLPRTQEAVLEGLDGLGLEVTTGASCSSVVAVLRGEARSARTGHRPTVLLRADMDALPVEEDVDLPYRSQVDGHMHACGHDLHTTMLVGAAHQLAGHRSALPGDVVFMFQPGEEGYDGARHMIDEGVLDAAGRRPDAAYALHVLSNLTPGIGTSRAGALMAASDALTVTVHGRGGHGAAPNLAADPVPAACEMVLALHTAMTRTVDPFSPAVLTVGRLTAGTRRNVIPASARFEATVRTFDPLVRARIAEVARRACQGIAAAHGLTVEISYREEYPVTVNDDTETAFALRVMEEVHGRGSSLPMAAPIMGSEDFSRVLAEVPGALLFLGACPPGRDPLRAPSIHSPQAEFSDTVLPDGSALLATLAMRRLGQTTGLVRAG